MPTTGVGEGTSGQRMRMETTETVTASAFRDPLLRVMGHLTSFTEGVPVLMAAVLEGVYQALGYTEDQLGIDGPTQTPRLRLLVQQAFNKNLRLHGLADNAGRGKWCLTSSGVKAAEILLSVVDTEEAPTLPGPQPFDGGAGVSWTLGEQINTYHADPYIIQVAAQNTACFGQFSDRSDVCKTCGIAGACKASIIDRLTQQAAVLRARDVSANKKDPEPVSIQDADNDEIAKVIDDLMAQVPDDAKRTKMSVTAKCGACAKAIPKNSWGLMVDGRGAFHEECHRPLK